MSSNKLSNMNEIPINIDFVIDQDFVDSMSKPGDSYIIKSERFLLFFPLYHIYLIYRIISQIINKNKMPNEEDLKNMGLNSSASYHLAVNYEKEIPFYRFIHNIMINNTDAIKVDINREIIDLLYKVDGTSLFRYAGKSPSVYGFNYSSIAAILGRHEIFRYFLEKEADLSQMVFIDTAKPSPIPLSVNECLLMNALFRWYKSDRKKMEKTAAQELIDTIILASNKCPAIVNDEHLLDVGIRVQWYWTHIKDAIEDLELLKQLIPLNPNAMNEILNTGG